MSSELVRPFADRQSLEDFLIEANYDYGETPELAGYDCVGRPVVVWLFDGGDDAPMRALILGGEDAGHPEPVDTDPDELRYPVLVLVPAEWSWAVVAVPSPATPTDSAGQRRIDAMLTPAPASPAAPNGQEERRPWCFTCNHEHIPTIPDETYACASQCGFGAWDIDVAVDHATRWPDHVAYVLPHRFAPSPASLPEGTPRDWLADCDNCGHFQDWAADRVCTHCGWPDEERMRWRRETCGCPLQGQDDPR